MALPARNSVGSGGAAIYVFATFLLLVGLHLAWRVEPTLRYHLSAPPFFLETAFAAKFWGAPGDPLRYLGAALEQLNYHSWLGAFAFTAVLAGNLVCARWIFARAAGRDGTGAVVVLVALVAAMPGRYEGAAEVTALGLLTALAAGWAWMASAPRAKELRLAWGWILGLVVFYLAGTLPAVLFVSLVLVSEVTQGRRFWLAFGCALVLLVVPVWAWLRPGFQPSAAMQQWGSGLTLALHVVAYLFVPVCMLVRAAWPLREALALGSWSPKLGWGMGLVVGLALVWTSVDPSRHALAGLGYFTSQRDWDRALAAAGKVRTWTSGARLQLTRAMFHAGQLPERLFSFPQLRGLDLLPDFNAGPDVSGAEAHVLLELGQVNLAEHMAHEALELEGSRPEHLRLIARINVLKGRPEVARVFLNRLRLVPFHRAEAERELRSLAADPAGVSNSELRLIQDRMPRTDEPDSHLPTEALLRQLLAANPTNRMAADYLLAHLLLNSRMEELTVGLGQSDRSGTALLPRPCQEALALSLSQPRGTSAPLADVRISPEVAGHYRRFVEVSQRRRTRPATARAELAPEFGDTFWFYDRFGESAPVTSGARRPL